MRLPTASKQPIAMHCLAPWRPGVQWPPDEPSVAARLGTAWHWSAATLIREGGYHWSTDDELAWSALVHVGLTTDHVHELMAMRPRDAVRALPDGCEAEVLLTLGPLRGFADVVWRTGERITHPVVRDWKTGYQDRGPVYADAQLLYFACSLATPDVDLVTIERARVAPNGEVALERHTFMPFELDVLREEFLSQPDRIATATPNPGGWCRQFYCPMREVCNEAE